MLKRPGVFFVVIIITGISLAVYLQYKSDSGPLNFSAERRRENFPGNYSAIDSAIHLLKDGDIALRTGADVISVMLRELNQRDKTYSHCGIVMVENGYPFVYHSIGGEDNPDAHLQRDSAVRFFSPISNERMGIARLQLTDSQVQGLHRIARRYFEAGVLFDMDFDIKSDDKLYCAEFVYKAVCEAAADSAYFSTSHLWNRKYVGVDNLTDARHARFICDVQFKL